MHYYKGPDWKTAKSKPAKSPERRGELKEKKKILQRYVLLIYVCECCHCSGYIIIWAALQVLFEQLLFLNLVVS